MAQPSDLASWASSPLPAEGGGVIRFDLETDGLWLGIMLYNPNNGGGLLVNNVDTDSVVMILLLFSKKLSNFFLVDCTRLTC
jgi:hypothetical protein